MTPSLKISRSDRKNPNLLLIEVLPIPGKPRIVISRLCKSSLAILFISSYLPTKSSARATSNGNLGCVFNSSIYPFGNGPSISHWCESLTNNLNFFAS